MDEVVDGEVVSAMDFPSSQDLIRHHAVDVIRRELPFRSRSILWVQSRASGPGTVNSEKSVRVL